MRVIIYIAITPNGYIGRGNGNSDFLSGGDYLEYLKMSKKAGNMVLGRLTYEYITSHKKYRFPFSGTTAFVMTSRGIKNRWPGRVIPIQNSPREAIRLLKRKGFKTLFLAGGAKLLSSFMAEGLVDEIYLTVVPIAIGNGIRLFHEAEFEKRLKLLGIKKFSSGTFRLHYKVLN